MTDTTELRAAFELWASDEGRWPAAVERDAAGCYKLAQTVTLWFAWKAGHASATQQHEGLRKDAERYQFLRDPANDDGPSLLGTYGLGDLDDAIDAALSVAGDKT